MNNLEIVLMVIETLTEKSHTHGKGYKKCTTFLSLSQSPLLIYRQFHKPFNSTNFILTDIL
jgi:hypothetical protein